MHTLNLKLESLVSSLNYHKGRFITWWAMIISIFMISIANKVTTFFPNSKRRYVGSSPIQHNEWPHKFEQTYQSGFAVSSCLQTLHSSKNHDPEIGKRCTSTAMGKGRAGYIKSPPLSWQHPPTKNHILPRVLTS